MSTPRAITASPAAIQLLNNLTREASDVRHALAQVTGSVEDARRNLTAGRRPAYSTSGLFGQHVLDAQESVSKINMLCDLASSHPDITEDDLADAMTGDPWFYAAQVTA